MEPLVEPLRNAPSPESVCARVLDLPYALLLESASAGDDAARYSFLCADPFLVVRSVSSRVECRYATGSPPPGPGWRRVGVGSAVAEHHDPFEAVAALLGTYRTDTVEGAPPFQGGAGGYFGYDLCRWLERVPAPRCRDLPLPDLCIGFYDWTLAWDHRSGEAWLISTGLPQRGSGARERARARAEAVRRRLAGARGAVAESRPVRVAGGAPDDAPENGAGPRPAVFPVEEIPGVWSTFSRAGYLAAVERIRSYIRAGDVFQANLSQRLEAPLTGTAFELYGRLRRRNPAPFAAYFDAGAGAVVSASPERFLELRAGRVETRPIKGTAPRGTDAEADARQAAALRASAKDRAENVMIVDLLRNDLSKVCADGSVEVTGLCRVETHPTVHHLVSTVAGRLRPGVGAVELLKAAFPGGSITGAPKPRAMQILAELEPTARSVYTGAIGYVGFDGSMDTNIAIRTFVVAGGRAYFQAGGGVVLDSDPEREYAESLDKARGLVAALAAEEAPAWSC